MTPVFFNSATVHARESFILRGGSWSKKNFSVRWALLPNTPSGPCLIDTGYSSLITTDNDRSWGLMLYAWLLRPKLLKYGQVEYVLSHYGLTPADISSVIVTHCHADHIASLRIFKNAKILISSLAIQQIFNTPKYFLWMKGIFPELLPEKLSERVNTFENCILCKVCNYSAYDLFGTGDCLAIALPGHARGHFGLVFPKKKIFYAVDCAWSFNAFRPETSFSWLANHIVDDSSQCQHTISIVRNFMVHGYKIVLCHEPEKIIYNV